MQRIPLRGANTRQRAFLRRKRGRKTPLFQMSGKSRGPLHSLQAELFPERILEVTGIKEAGG